MSSTGRVQSVQTYTLRVWRVWICFMRKVTGKLSIKAKNVAPESHRYSWLRELFQGWYEIMCTKFQELYLIDRLRPQLSEGMVSDVLQFHDLEKNLFYVRKGTRNSSSYLKPLTRSRFHWTLGSISRLPLPCLTIPTSSALTIPSNPPNITECTSCWQRARMEKAFVWEAFWPTNQLELSLCISSTE